MFQVVVQLFRLQFLLTNGGGEAATELVSQAAPQLEALPQTGLSGACIAQLRLHFLLLKALLLIRQGNFASLVVKASEAPLPVNAFSVQSPS